jgi:MerR family transcriptional regulator, light-induced transcriptional regulator
MRNRQLTIASMAEQTGIAKEVLRKWETRYGFPVPGRDAAGQRLYPSGQTRRLKLIKKLLDDGMRPGQIVALEEERLTMLLAERCVAIPHRPASDTADNMALASDPLSLRALLQTELARRGLRNFVLYAMPALNEAVGNAWSSSEISVKDEHLYTEAVQMLLRHAICGLVGAPSSAPRLLLTTPPGELHTLGILMVEALMTLEGASCISLGAQTPLPEIASASQAYQADIVGLCFSAAYPRKKIAPFLRELRALCPANIQIWAGGAGVLRMERFPRGVSAIPTLVGTLLALQRHRQSPLQLIGGLKAR